MSTDLRTIQRHLDERARAILDAVELLEKNGFSVQLNANGAASRGEPFPSARARSTAGMHAAPGESWPQAVDRILSSAPTPMSIDDLVTALIAQGKEFRGNMRRNPLSQSRRNADMASSCGMSRSRGLGWAYRFDPTRLGR